MQPIIRLGGVTLLIVAFFFALGAVVALGHGNVLIGLVMFLLATLLAVAGWMLWDYRRGQSSSAAISSNDQA